MKNEALFRTGSVWKSIFSMAVPSIIIILVMVLYNMADMFFVGCLGDTAQVAAVSVVGPVFSILAAVATMLGAGSSAIIARCFGAGEIEQGKICSSLCFWTSFFLGVLVSIGLLVGRVPLLGMLGSNAEIFPYAERYLQVLALGAPCFILSNSMAMLVRAEGAVKEGLIGNLLGTLVNCIFDPLFILVLNFGVSGAAAASVLGNLVATGCYLRYIVKHGTVLTVDFRPALKKPQMLGEMLAIGLPNGISSLLAGFASSFSNRLLVTHGTAEKQAYDLLLKRENSSQNQYKQNLAAWEAENQRLWSRYDQARSDDYGAYRDEIKDDQWLREFQQAQEQFYEKLRRQYGY